MRGNRENIFHDLLAFWSQPWPTANMSRVFTHKMDIWDLKIMKMMFCGVRALLCSAYHCIQKHFPNLINYQSDKFGIFSINYCLVVGPVCLTCQWRLLWCVDSMFYVDTVDSNNFPRVWCLLIQTGSRISVVLWLKCKLTMFWYREVGQGCGCFFKPFLQ